jgi:hypothetical protein
MARKLCPGENMSKKFEKNEQSAAADEACEIIELAAEDLDLLAEAFDIISEACAAGAEFNGEFTVPSEETIIH